MARAPSPQESRAGREELFSGSSVRSEPLNSHPFDSGCGLCPPFFAISVGFPFDVAQRSQSDGNGGQPHFHPVLGADPTPSPWVSDVTEPPNSVFLVGFGTADPPPSLLNRSLPRGQEK